jgi:hypothetical protein
MATATATLELASTAAGATAARAPVPREAIQAAPVNGCSFRLNTIRESTKLAGHGYRPESAG